MFSFKDDQQVFKNDTGENSWVLLAQLALGQDLVGREQETASSLEVCALSERFWTERERREGVCGVKREEPEICKCNRIQAEREDEEQVCSE